MSPNTAAKALTGTAFDARDEVRRTLPQHFTLRRPWVSRGIGVTAAQPRTLMAEVFSRDRFMAPQEYGGTKDRTATIPVGRMGAIAQSRVIPRSQWAGRLMATKPNVFHRGGAIFERSRGGIQALYLIRRAQPVKARLGMAATVRSVALREFRRQMDRALRAEMARG